MRTNRFLLLLLYLLSGRSSFAEEPTSPPRADLVIRRPAGPSEIVITTTSRLAGAVHSLTWNGQEFIDSTDHGRQLQSASSFSSGGSHWAEAFNPTEAGSRDDGTGPRSTSRLLHSLATEHSLQTTTQMAFWLAPGQTSEGHPARNTTKLSNHLLTKRVRIGLPDLPQVVSFDVTFTLPADEQHSFAQFEALTGYMPELFRSFWTFQPATGELQPLSNGPGEQPFPIVVATESGRHAMGIYSPQQPSVGFENAGYGRWRFEREQVVKWNTVFRLRHTNGIESSEYSFRNFVIVGDRETVRTSLAELHRRFPPSKKLSGN
jgi:hypothetical protein